MQYKVRNIKTKFTSMKQISKTIYTKKDVPVFISMFIFKFYTTQRSIITNIYWKQPEQQTDCNVPA